MLLLVAIQRVLATQVVVRDEQEAPCAAGRVVDGLSRTALHVGGVLFK